MSNELVTEVSTSFTSPLMRAMMSPFLSSEKNPKGSSTTFLYTISLMSRTTPVRSGIMMAEEPK